MVAVAGATGDAWDFATGHSIEIKPVNDNCLNNILKCADTGMTITLNGKILIVKIVESFVIYTKVASNISFINATQLLLEKL